MDLEIFDMLSVGTKQSLDFLTAKQPPLAQMNSYRFCFAIRMTFDVWKVEQTKMELELQARKRKELEVGSCHLPTAHGFAKVKDCT